jgi:hypothetical protein
MFIFIITFLILYVYFYSCFKNKNSFHKKMSNEILRGLSENNCPLNRLNSFGFVMLFCFLGVFLFHWIFTTACPF